MKVLGRGAILVLLACGSAGCAALHARAAPEPLATPPPPPRVLIPLLESAPLANTESPLAAPNPDAPREVILEAPPRAPGRTEPRPVAAASPPADAPPDAGPVEVPRTLQATANAAATEQRVRTLLASAARDLGRIDYRALGENGRAQYDVAKRFARQAEEALRDRNVVFAEQLADKAAGLATLLLK